MNAENNYVEDVHQGRLDMMKAINEQRELDDPYTDENYRDPLCIDTFIIKDIVLSTGGPADGFKLKFSDLGQGDNNHELISGVYYRADWGTYKESALSDEEAQTVFDFYMGGTL